MRLIRSVLEKFDDQRGKGQLPSRKLEFNNIWSILLFTSDGDFCSQFQKDLRNSLSGCKWMIMDTLFGHGLEILQFVQKIVIDVPEKPDLN